ncbi:MAG TPA: DUF4328 domain-containing protein [Rubricoccaceae bacterium]|nr:DUF4328 domain-containing protein [Rubricoccaceae bacterium]
MSPSLLEEWPPRASEGARQRVPTNEQLAEVDRRSRHARWGLVAYGATMVMTYATAILVGAVGAFELEEAYAAGDLFVILLFLVAAFFVGRWKVAAYRLLPALGARFVSHSPGWAAGAYFVPFLNLWRPYQIMREIWEGSDPGALRVDLEEKRPDALLPLWWGLWISMNVLGQITRRLDSPALTPEQEMTVGVLSLVYAALALGATIALYLIIRRVNSDQQQRGALLQRSPADLIGTSGEAQP